MKKILAWIKSFFTKKKKASAPAKKKRNTGTPGELNLSEALDLIPYYHRILARMPKRARFYGSMLAKVGPLVLNKTTPLFANNKKLWHVNPSQVFIGWPPEHDGPVFLAAIKRNPPLGVERLEGECYEYLLYYDFKSLGDPEFSNWWGGYFWVDDSGRFTLARQRQLLQKTILRKHKRRGQSRTIQVPYTEYKDSFFEAYMASNEEANDALNAIFVNAFNFWHRRADGWLVVTKKNNQRVTFNISEGRHKYFFKEREKIVETPTGQRKRIFHIVDEHDRNVNGKIVRVKEHIRGIRHFFWNGLECHIFSPGWHGYDYFLDMPFKTYDFDQKEDLPDGKLVKPEPILEKAARLMEGTDYKNKKVGWG